MRFLRRKKQKDTVEQLMEAGELFLHMGLATIVAGMSLVVALPVGILGYAFDNWTLAGVGACIPIAVFLIAMVLGKIFR